MHNQAFDAYQQNWLKAADDFESRLSNLDVQGISNQQSKKTALDSAYKDYVSNIKDARKEYASTITAATKMVYDNINTSRDDQRAQEQNGWNILNQAIDNYGHLVPQSIIDRVSKMLPAGTNIQDIINTPTFAERNSKRISGAGGTGTGGAGSFDVTASPQGQAFSGVTANQLREAVDRVTMKFGGTAAERNRKRGEYLDRINSGESPASIMTSMQNDYWATQTGSAKTAHDGRSATEGNADSLQSAVDYYGITGTNDGPLGSFDSKVQGLESLVGLSSDEYNNLASTVGAIRANLVHENYGSAVSANELKLAQSWIPSMSDKGAIFITKLQNLKAQTAYLDAKVFASESGLPAPKPPVPITLSGNGVSGTAKYSTSNITDVLSQ